jgi:nucleotide-binding universal stress UspA family protein
MFHNILVCVDGSVHADHALDEAIDLATVGNARMTLLTAIPRPSYWATSPATAQAIEPLSVELERGAKKALDEAVARVPQSVPVTKILSRKPIREALLEELQTGRYDLLVMGSRGRGALAASVLGSVSHFALNHNSVPVLIVHSRDGESDVHATDDAAPVAGPVR